MRILFLLFCLYFITGQSAGQTKLTISYVTTFEPYGESTIPKEAVNKFLLVTKDSFSYLIPYQSKYDSSHLPNPLGSKFRGHSTFVNFSSRLVLMQSHPMGMKRLLVEDTFKVIEWNLEEGTKIIAGYSCKKATAKIDKRDITAFYTSELPASIGPNFVGGLPGTVLQFWWEQSSYITTAKSVQHDAMDIIEPVHGKRVSMIGFETIKKRLRKQ